MIDLALRDGAFALNCSTSDLVKGVLSSDPKHSENLSLR